MSVNVHPLSEFDGLLRERLLAATDAPREADWRDVERRAGELVSKRQAPRLLRRPRVLAVALVLAAVAVAVPALGLDRVVVDFFSSAPAPEIVKIDAHHWFEEIAPEGRSPGVATNEMRKVHVFTVAGGNLALFMAPAKDGYCWSLKGVAGACEARGSRVISPIWGDVPPPNAASPKPLMVTGPINAANAVRLVVTFQDGEAAEIPFVLVSEPIGAGFFYYEVPQAHRAKGARPARLTAYGPNDQRLGSASLVYDEGR